MGIIFREHGSTDPAWESLRLYCILYRLNSSIKSLLCMGTIPCFSAIFTVETTFVTFCWLPLKTEPYKKRFILKGKNLFPLKQILFFKSRPLEI